MILWLKEFSSWHNINYLYVFGMNFMEISIVWSSYLILVRESTSAGTLVVFNTIKNPYKATFVDGQKFKHLHQYDTNIVIDTCYFKSEFSLYLINILHTFYQHFISFISLAILVISQDTVCFIKSSLIIKVNNS